MTLILANGTVLGLSNTQNKDIFDAARVGLGALGIVNTVTLKTVPLFKLK